MKVMIELSENMEPISITVDGKKFVYQEPKPKHKTIADYLDTLHGAKEWDETVEKIQTWYYGSYVKDAWCATTISYAAAQIGILNNIGGKNENVYEMFRACENAEELGLGRFIDEDYSIHKGDLIFFAWENKFDHASSKHVTVAYWDTEPTAKQVLCIGGNQKNKICRLYYDTSKIVGVYRPNYKGGN